MMEGKGVSTGIKETNNREFKEQKYKTHVYDICPECGATMIPDSGCSYCPFCGYSPCK